jgi:hypothetical protein
MISSRSSGTKTLYALAAIVVLSTWAAPSAVIFGNNTITGECRLFYALLSITRQYAQGGFLSLVLLLGLELGIGLRRNYLSGVVGDNINVMLAAAGYNFKRLLRKLKHFLLDVLRRIFAGNAGRIALEMYF